MKNNKESRLQQDCVYWFRVEYPHFAMLLTHPINEGSDHTSQDRRRQAIHKAEGTVPGVPDLLLFLPAMYVEKESNSPSTIAGNTYYGLGIEMKTPTGRQSQEQKDFQKMFEAAGYKYIIVRTLDDFKEVINDYIEHACSWIKFNVAEVHRKLVKARNERELAYFKKVIGKK